MSGPAAETVFPILRNENVLVFMRHCEPLFPDDQKYFLGRTDWPLSPEGRRHAEEIQGWVSNVSLSGCFCSPLKRTRETAEIVCGNTGFTPVKTLELREIDLGEWDGRSKGDVMSEYPALFEQREKDLLKFMHPGGESFADLEARVVPFLLSLCRNNGRWLVVSHAGVYRVLLHSVFGVQFPQVFRHDPGYGDVRVIERTGTLLKIRDSEGFEAELR